MAPLSPIAGGAPSSIVVCPLSRLGPTFASSGADDVVTLMTRGTREVPALAAGRRLWLELSDITAPTEGYRLPDTAHIEALLDFGRTWTRRRPLLIHCYAGVSRSTAAAFILACALQPDHDEATLAVALRAASPTATPNARLVALADTALTRDGRMAEAIARLGRGEECFEGVPFSLPIDGPRGPAP